jgi:hypothetical protein
MKDLRTTNMLMVTALMLALAAMLAGPAFGRVVDDGGTTVYKSTSSTTTFDDKASLYKGTGAESSGRTVIPYLSHGMGVDESRFSGGQTARHNGGWYTGLEYADPPKLVQSDDGFDWGGIQIGAGVALAALLLAAMSTLALRSKDGGKPATS